MSLRIPSPSSAIGLMAVVLLSACGTAGGAGGAASGFIGGQPGQICQPKYQDEGCANVNGGGFEKVKCDATDPAKPVWSTLGKCATGESCREVAQKTPANTPMKTAECYLYQAVTPTGTADATSGDSKSGGDSITADIVMDGTVIMACGKLKCASQISACNAIPDCAASLKCNSACKDMTCMMNCPSTDSAADDALSACLITNNCIPGITAKCGDGMCVGPVETKANCPADCSIPVDKCGNGKCDAGESSSNCPTDCPTTGPKCGNGTCEAGESSSNCPADCPTTGPKCGNGMCESGESMSTCPADCKTTSAKCGDMVCASGENCPLDCDTKFKSSVMCLQQACGSLFSACANDTTCLSFFNCNIGCNCDKSCESGCMEMIGSPSSALSAMAECTGAQECPDPCPASGPVCGNSMCESGESPTSCPKDCKATTACGNGKCESGETASNCAKDCGGSSGTGCAPDTTSKGGCGGCACEACVCAADDWCCTTGWDSACSDACVKCPGSGCAP